MTTPIEFNDIQVGDKIRATKTEHYGGDTTILSGTVLEVGQNLFQTHSFFFSAVDADQWKFELLERPLDTDQVEAAVRFLCTNFGYEPTSTRVVMHAERFVRSGVIFPEVNSVE